jgi:hypothetical protein
MLPPLEQQILDWGLLGLGVYFAVQIARGTAGYLRFRRVAPTAIVAWPAPRPALFPWLVALGVLGVSVAAVNAWMRRPPHHVLALVLMAAYFLGLVPLARRIRLGLYRDGVWAHRGFLPWAGVARITFVETPQVVLLLQPRRGGVSHKLPVPDQEYGTVRKILAEKARAGALQLHPVILGL